MKKNYLMLYTPLCLRLLNERKSGRTGISKRISILLQKRAEIRNENAEKK